MVSLVLFGSVCLFDITRDRVVIKVNENQSE